MQTSFAQIISLTSYGNEFINSGKVDPNYFSHNTVFQHCSKVEFKDFVNPSFLPEEAGKICAENPNEWFNLLKQEGCSKLRLYYTPSNDKTQRPEYDLVGFVGGNSNWLIETIFDSYSHYWYNRWEVSNREAPDNKIWSVRYGRPLIKYSIANQQAAIEEIKVELRNTLWRLKDFCMKQKLQTWLETFAKAEIVMDAQNPAKDYYHFDLIVNKNYSLPAQQLLFSAATSWVFGGMGWWNDMGFSDQAVQAQYLELSKQLYQLIKRSIIAATNSF